MDCLITLAILSGILYFNRGRVRRLLWGYDPGDPQTLEVPWEPIEEQGEQDPADRLTRLHELYEKGVLTEEEYQRKKKELLDQM